MAAIIERYDRTRHDPGTIKSLLAMAVVRPTLDKLAYLVDVFYASECRSIFIMTRNGRVTAIIGVDHTVRSYGFITHLAVHPDTRKKGLASRLIKHVATALELEEIGAETEQDIVGFYSACGFQTREIQCPCMGVHRFRCIKNVKRSI